MACPTGVRPSAASAYSSTLTSVGLSSPRCTRTWNACSPSREETSVDALRTAAQCFARLSRHARICAPQPGHVQALEQDLEAGRESYSWRYCRTIRLDE